ncbi:hypothetical protein Tco_1561161 [Tanacetum coccineum]
MIFHIDSAMKHSYSNDDTCFGIDVIDEILEEDFDALINEGSEILHSIKGTILEEKLFAEFDEFMAMTADENSESESDTEEPPLKKSPLTPITRLKHLLKNLQRILNSNLFLITWNMYSWKNPLFFQSLVIRKRVEDHQLGIESYQKEINTTKPQTIKSGMIKRDPYTPYQDPQGFIYVDNKGRNRLMRSDELYKFSDKTLTGLQTSLDDITKGYQMVVHAKEEDRSLLMERKELIFIIKAIDSAV